MTLGQRILYLRKKLNMSQDKVADASGISRVMISYYENDKREPSLINAMCLADALGVSLEYLARGEDR